MRDIRAGTTKPKAPKPPKVSHVVTTRADVAAAKTVKTKRSRPFHTAALKRADEIDRIARNYGDNPVASARRLRELHVPAAAIRAIHGVHLRNMQELAAKGFAGASRAELARERRAAAGPGTSVNTASKQAKPLSHNEQLKLSVDVGLKRAGVEQHALKFGLSPLVASPGRTAHNFEKQLERAPAELGPALVTTARAIGSDAASAVTLNRGHPLRNPHSQTLEKVLKPSAKGLRYLVSHDPIVVRVDKNGKPVYRAKGGGETPDVHQADRSIGAKIQERPLDYLLIGRGAALGAGKAIEAGAARGLLGESRKTIATPGRLELRSRTGEKFTTRSSSNPVRRGEQESTRRLTTGATGAIENAIGRELPVVGEHARAVRLGAKQQRHAQQAEISRAIHPFQRAFRPLSAGEKIAVVLHAKGVSPSELRAFVESRLEAARLRGDRAEIRDHKRMLRFLSKTDDATYGRVLSDPKMKTARDAAEKISTASGDILEAVGKLEPEHRELRKYLTARVVGGARFVETKAKKGRVEQTRNYPGRSKTITRARSKEEAQKRLASLDARYEKMVDTVAQTNERPSDYADTTRRRNMQAKKRANKGLKPLPTVSSELRVRAEKQLLAASDKSKTPYGAKLRALLTEREQLRAQLNEHAEAAFEVTPRMKFEERLKRDKPGAIAEYEKRYGKVVNTDLARELSPEYAASNEARALYAAHVHEPASDLAKAVFKAKLERPPTGNGHVLFTAGGTGAGKTVAVGSTSDAEIVYDTNLNSLSSSTSKIDQALKSGRHVDIHYVYREPLEALTEGALPRAEKRGRTVPLEEHVKTHVGSNKVIRQIAAKYAGDPRVTIKIFHNQTGETPREIPLSSLPSLRHNEIANAARQALEEAHRSGTISEHTYQGFSQSSVGEAHAADALQSRGGVGEAPFGQVEEVHPGKPRSVHLREIKAQRAGGEFQGGPAIEDLKQRLEGQVFHHADVGKQLREGHVPQNQSGANPPKSPDIARRNRAIRLMTSRWLPTPQAWQDGYLKAIGYAHAIARGELAYKIARPLNPDGTANRGWHYVNLGEAKTAVTRAEKRAAKSRELELKQAKESAGISQGMDDFLAGDGDLEKYIDDELATKSVDTAKRWEAEGKRVAQISPSDYRNIFGEFKGSTAFVRNVLDRPTDFWRALTLSYRPAWVVNNFVGQTLLYAINHATPGGAKAYAQSVLDEGRRSDRYFPEDLRYGLFESESTQAGSLPGPRVVAGVAAGARNAERSLRVKIGQINAALSDNIPRRAAWYAVADKHRKLLNRIENTNKTLDQFLGELEKAGTDLRGNAKLKQIHDDLVQQVLDELIDFSDLSVFERRVIRRAIPFYSWLKGITKATVRLGLNKPLTTELLVNLSQSVGQDELRKWLGAGENVLQNFAPFSVENTKAGRIATGLSTAGLNPEQSVSDVVRMIHAGLSANPESPFDNPANALAPWLQAGIEGLSRRDLFSGKKLSSPGGIPGIIAKQYVRGFPQEALAERLVNPAPEMAKNNKAKLSPGGGDLHGIPHEVLSYLGLPIRRKNLDRAASIDTENRMAKLSAPEKRRAKVRELRDLFSAELKKYSSTHVAMTPVIDRALRAREIKEVMVAKAEDKAGGHLTPLERYGVYMDILARMGKITPAEAATFKQRAHHATEHDLRYKFNPAIAAKYFGGAILGLAAKELRAKGSKIELTGH